MQFPFYPGSPPALFQFWSTFLPKKKTQGRIAGSFSEQRLVIEPSLEKKKDAMDYGSERIVSLSPLSRSRHPPHLYNPRKKRLGTSEPFIFQVRARSWPTWLQKPGMWKFLLRLCLVATWYNHDSGEQWRNPISYSGNLDEFSCVIMVHP